MNRRKYLILGGGAIVAVAGGTAVASATRTDILADTELTRGEGEAVTIEKTITRDSAEYLESTNDVRENGHTEPFRQWARRECESIGASEVLTVVENRLDKSVEGVGSGVRFLLFGPVISVDRTVTRDRDGSTVSEPNVTLERLVSVAPRSMTITVILDGHGFTKKIPVGVGHGEVSMQ